MAAQANGAEGPPCRAHGSAHCVNLAIGHIEPRQFRIGHTRSTCSDNFQFSHFEALLYRYKKDCLRLINDDLIDRHALFLSKDFLIFVKILGNDEVGILVALVEDLWNSQQQDDYRCYTDVLQILHDDADEWPDCIPVEVAMPATEVARREVISGKWTSSTHSRAIYAAPALCMRDADIRSDNDVGPKLFDFLDNDFRIFLFDGTISQKWRTSCPDGVPPVSKTFMERIVLSLDKFFKYGSPLSSLQAGTERNAMRTK